MNRFFEWIIINRRTVVILFVIALAISILLSRIVSVNYDMLDYLPDGSPSTVALRIMEAEYDGGIPNARVMVPDVTISQAIAIKEQLEAVDGVEDVIWLDDTVSLEVPLATIDTATLETYYKEGYALFILIINEYKQIKALHEIKDIIGEDGAISGSVVDTAVATETTTPEVKKSIVLIIPILFIILLLTTASWFEPVLFMITIGVAIILNNGTNVFFGEISFITNAAGSILQLAISMDYSIFLLHRFTEFQKDGLNVEDAMKAALIKSVGSITASGITTVIGFAALILMRFKIGPDMGLVMAKAIVFSLVSVLVILPVLTLFSYKLIDKTHHKPLISNFKWLAGFICRFKIPSLIIFLVLIIPSFLAQSNNSFYYGLSMTYDDASTQVGNDKLAIEDIFGKSNTLALIVPKGEFAKETALSIQLHEIPQIISIISYVDNVGAEVPIEYIDNDILSMLISDNYSRMMLTIKTDYEGDMAFDVVEQIKKATQEYYGDNYHLAGESVSTYDLKSVVTSDIQRVNFIAMSGVFLVLLLTFKSLSLPLILVFVIESSIWLNLSIPYFIDETTFFIAYLITSSILLGATVYYAILLTSRYIDERKTLDKKNALQKASQSTILPILTSSIILTVGCLILGVFSTHGIISQLGFLLARGASLSAIMVLFVLPSLLYTLDEVIIQTSIGLHLFKNKEEMV